jgi:hypothetical protein
MRVLSIVVVSLLVCAAKPSASGQEWPGVFFPNQLTKYSVHWALAGAAVWLQKPECRGVFAEFKDQDGIPLDQKLARLNVDEVAYLRMILFRDGSHLAPCKKAATVMFTTPGSKLVFVCERQLQEQVRQDRVLVNALVIHEALHTLGLGENPPHPTTWQITDRVKSRCWR